MDRTNFYNVVTVDNTQELDHLWNSLSGFEEKYAPNYYRVEISDLMRPDLISYKNYGTVEFWWVICLVNSISNPLNDLTVGQILSIPAQQDIYSFQRKFRVRRSR